MPGVRQLGGGVVTARGPEIRHIVNRLKVAAVEAERSGLPDLRQLLDDAGMTVLMFQLTLQHIAAGQEDWMVSPKELAETALDGYARLRLALPKAIVASNMVDVQV
jgi:hypothetical protein